MFYELENLEDINDRTVLKVFEVDKNGIPCKSGNEIHEPITATVTVFKVSTIGEGDELITATVTVFKVSTEERAIRATVTVSKVITKEKQKIYKTLSWQQRCL